MTATEEFNRRNAELISRGASDSGLLELTRRWLLAANSYEYSYHFQWLSRPIIQYPQDIVAIQELIWTVRPDLIIETGVAHGGSLVLSASMLALLDYCDALSSHSTLDPQKRRVIGIDIDIRPHNRRAIETHPLSPKIELIQGSSIAPEIVDRVRERALGHDRIMVLLDSNHTHDHVLAELNAFAPLVSVGSYCVVFDTVIEQMPEGLFPNRPWSRGNNPMTAVNHFLKTVDGSRAVDGEPLHFEVDSLIDNKLLISVAPGGYLRRVRRSNAR